MHLLHIRHASGYIQTVTFPSAFARALVMITLRCQPVTLRVEDGE